MPRFASSFRYVPVFVTEVRRACFGPGPRRQARWSPAGGTRIIEIWESKADQQKFFNDNLKPNLPPEVVPDITYYELHAAFTR